MVWVCVSTSIFMVCFPLARYRPHYSARTRERQRAKCYAFGAFAMPRAFDKVDEQGRRRHRDERPEDARRRDIAKRQRQHGKVGKQIGAGEPPFRLFGDDSARASSPPEEPPCRTTRPTPTPTKHPPNSAARSGWLLRSGQDGAGELPEAEEGRAAQRGHAGADEELRAQRAPAEEIAGRVQHGSQEPRRDAEVMVEQKHHAQHARPSVTSTRRWMLNRPKVVMAMPRAMSATRRGTAPRAGGV